MADIETRRTVGRAIRDLRTATLISCAVLADELHVSEAHMRNIENGNRNASRAHLQRLDDFLQTGGLLAALAGSQDGLTRRSILQAVAALAAPKATGLVTLTEALAQYPFLNNAESPATTADTLLEGARRAQEAYQAARYPDATQLLAKLVVDADALVATSSGEQLRQALIGQARVYVAAAKLTVKLRTPHAWLTAERAMTAASRSECPLLMSAATYQLACALARAGQTEAAERIAVAGTEAAPGPGPEGISHLGALRLFSAVMAARRGDGGAAHERLRLAQVLADELGGDGNHGWTAFGRGNVEIHRVSVAVGLGDPSVAVATAAALDTGRLPEGLRSRRAQVRIEGAWGLVERRRDAEAVAWLAEADRAAPAAFRSNAVARQVLQTMLGRERRGAIPSLRGLAARAGVAQ